MSNVLQSLDNVPDGQLDVPEMCGLYTSEEVIFLVIHFLTG